MTTRPHFALGLIVGKFAPLHLGHEYLIDQADRDCERLLILSYCNPDPIGCSVQRRRKWLEHRFPKHEVLLFDQQWLDGTCRESAVALRSIPANDSSNRAQQDFLAWLLVEVLKRKPDAFYCSEAYGPSCAETLSNALGGNVQAVVVDRNREHVPISASGIRADPCGLRHWMNTHVASDFTIRVALVGGESTGKTTLAAALADHFGTQWVPEYGRELWESQSGVLAEADLLKIAREQIRRELKMAVTARRYLFCDTSPLTTSGYSLWMFGRIDPTLAELAAREYDAIVLCRPDFPFVQDGTRRDDSFRVRQDKWYQEKLASLTCPTLAVGGTVPDRVSAVSSWLSQ